MQNNNMLFIAPGSPGPNGNDNFESINAAPCQAADIPCQRCPVWIYCLLSKKSVFVGWSTRSARCRWFVRSARTTRCTWSAWWTWKYRSARIAGTCGWFRYILHAFQYNYWLFRIFISGQAGFPGSPVSYQLFFLIQLIILGPTRSTRCWWN